MLQLVCNPDTAVRTGLSFFASTSPRHYDVYRRVPRTALRFSSLPLKWREEAAARTVHVSIAWVAFLFGGDLGGGHDRASASRPQTAERQLPCLLPCHSL
ncbi:hypothetical protein EJ06DRAFT_526213, partial [Trichodelitschia bisporula]